MSSIEDRIREIEQMICRWELTPAQVFTQMLQLMPADKPVVAVPDLKQIADILENVVDFTKEDEGRTKAILDAEDMCDKLRSLSAASHSQQSAERITKKDAKAIIAQCRQNRFRPDGEWLPDLLARLNAERCPIHESEQP